MVCLDRLIDLVYAITNTIMRFVVNQSVGKPIYVQLMEQIRHAVEVGSLRSGDQLPSIRTLAQELVVTPNTVAKAYTELEHEGLLGLRQGSGAYVMVRPPTRTPVEKFQAARAIVSSLLEELRELGLADEEILRLLESELVYETEVAKKS